MCLYSGTIIITDEGNNRLEHRILRWHSHEKRWGAPDSSVCKKSRFDLHRRGQHTARQTQTLSRESEPYKTVRYVFAALAALNEPNGTALLIQQVPV